jgi:hypothetical protein
MTKVFIGGSRRVSRLSDPILVRLDRIIEQGFPVLIGDANGADKAVQLYLKSKNYSNVEVFCSGRVCRNNIGNWKQRNISSTADNKTYAFYAAKDQTMADDATIGLMVWDGKSKGTLLNVFRLLKQRKNAIVYNVPEKCFLELRDLAQWTELLSHCDSELRNKVEQQAVLEDQKQNSLFPESFKPHRNSRRARVNDSDIHIPDS